MFTHWQYEVNTFSFLGILAFFPSNSLVVKHNLAIRVVTGYHEHSECFLQSFWIVVGCQWKWQFTCSIKKITVFRIAKYLKQYQKVDLTVKWVQLIAKKIHKAAFQQFWFYPQCLFGKFYGKCSSCETLSEA